MQFQLNRLLIVFVALVIVGTVTPLLLLQPWKKSSQEMSMLLKVEARLELPDGVSRAESDAGRYEGEDGAVRNERRITRFYDESAVISKLPSTLQSKGWAKRYTAEAGKESSQVMVSVTERSCIELRTSKQTGAKDDDGPVNRIVLMAESDDACSGYLQ